MKKGPQQTNAETFADAFLVEKYLCSCFRKIKNKMKLRLQIMATMLQKLGVKDLAILWDISVKNSEFLIPSITLFSCVAYFWVIPIIFKVFA